MHARAAAFGLGQAGTPGPGPNPRPHGSVDLYRSTVAYIIRGKKGAMASKGVKLTRA